MSRHAVVAGDRVPVREGIVAFLSSTTRHGRWTLPRYMRVAAIFGNVELDLREAEIAEGVSEIEILGVFANVEVTVPPGVRVESVGHAFLGNFELRMRGAPDFPPDAPVIRIRGSAYFATVEAAIKVIGRRELRAERKLLGG